MLKKMTLLAIAAAVLAIPASASAATHWTDSGVVVKEGVDITASFEGTLDFFLVGNSYECSVTAKITVTGPTTGRITQFSPTTSSCKGGGVFLGCKLKADKTNIPSGGWNILNGTSFLTISYPTVETELTVFSEYETGCPIPSSDLEFHSISLTPTLDEKGSITKLNVVGFAKAGITSGALVPEGAATLGLVTK